MNKGKNFINSIKKRAVPIAAAAIASTGIIASSRSGGSVSIPEQLNKWQVGRTIKETEMTFFDSKYSVTLPEGTQLKIIVSQKEKVAVQTIIAGKCATGIVGTNDIQAWDVTEAQWESLDVGYCTISINGKVDFVCLRESPDAYVVDNIKEELPIGQILFGTKEVPEIDEDLQRIPLYKSLNDKKDKVVPVFATDGDGGNIIKKGYDVIDYLPIGHAGESTYVKCMLVQEDGSIVEGFIHTAFIIGDRFEEEYYYDRSVLMKLIQEEIDGVER